MRKVRVVAALLAICLASASLAQQQAKRFITETDLFRFVWVADPQPSPDGTRVAFTRVIVNEKGEGYDTALWIVPADGSAPPSRLTIGTRDSQPRWSPDGKRIAFLRAPLKDGKPEPAQVHILSLSGGEAWRLTDVPRGASAAVWSPDGKRIAFTSGANAKDLEKQRREKAARKTAQDVDVPRPAETESKPKPPAAVPNESDRDSDVRTITRAVYRVDNAGYIDPEHLSHIWIADVPDATDEPVAARQITEGKYEEGDPIWSRDGAKIYYTSTRVDEPYYELPQSDIYAVAATGGEPEKIAALPFDIGQTSLSPDGSALAFVAEVSEPVRSYSQPDLWVLELSRNATPKNLTTDFDFDVGAGIGGDQRAPRGNSGARIAWTLQHVERLGAALLLVDAAHAQAEGDVVGAIEMRKQGVALEHHRRTARRRRQVGDVLGSQDDVALARLLVAGDHAQGRGLAAAARAQQAAIGARRDAQADGVHRHGLAVALGHGHQFDVRLRCHRAPGKQAPCHYCKIDPGRNRVSMAQVQWRKVNGASLAA